MPKYCPHCEKPMKYKHEVRQGLDFSGTAEDYELMYDYFEYKCPTCKIKYDGEWHIPEKFAPTNKQKNAILFINNRLHLGLEALTKHQCWKDINRYFETAKNTPLWGAYLEDDGMHEIAEMAGMTEEW